MYTSLFSVNNSIWLINKALLKHCCMEVSLLKIGDAGKTCLIWRYQEGCYIESCEEVKMCWNLYVKAASLKMKIALDETRH